MEDAARTLAIVVNAVFGGFAILLVAIGVAAARSARRRLAAVCGVLLLAAGVGAGAMAVSLLGEGEPAWFVALWFAVAAVLLGVSARDFAAARG